MNSRRLLLRTLTLLLLIVVLGIVPVDIGYSAQTSVRAVSQVFVVDSNGKILGNASGNLGILGPWLIEIDRKIFAISAEPNGYARGTLFYELPDCQGTAWFLASPVPPGWPVQSAVASPGNTLYTPSDTVASQTIAIQSALFNDGCIPFGGTSMATPAEAVVDLDTVYTLPFSVRVVPLRGNGILPPGR